MYGLQFIFIYVELLLADHSAKQIVAILVFYVRAYYEWTCVLGWLKQPANHSIKGALYRIPLPSIQLVVESCVASDWMVHSSLGTTLITSC